MSYVCTKFFFDNHPSTYQPYSDAMGIQILKNQSFKDGFVWSPGLLIMASRDILCREHKGYIAIKRDSLGLITWITRLDNLNDKRLRLLYINPGTYAMSVIWSIGK